MAANFHNFHDFHDFHNFHDFRGVKKTPPVTCLVCVGTTPEGVV